VPVVPAVPVVTAFWSTIVPVMVGFALCGVAIIVLPETQYEYFVSPASVSVTTLPEVAWLPLVDGAGDTNPSPPVCWTLAEHVHPPPATDVQWTEA
jgi:hypothetical protein